VDIWRPSAVDRRGFEHRGENVEPAFHEISPEVGGELREVGPITTPRFGDGGGPEARSARPRSRRSVSSCISARESRPGSIASASRLPLTENFVTGVRAHGTG